MQKTRYVTWLSVLIAFVILFQVFGSYIKIGATTLSFVLVPIVLGGMLLGVGAGAVLGFTFAVAVLIMGLTGADPFTNILLAQAPVGTVITVFLKGVLAGVLPAFAYKAIAKKNDVTATFVAAALAPIINTGVFIACMLVMSNVVQANFCTDGTSVIYFLVITCAGINFIVELLINLLLAPSVKRVAYAVAR